MIAPSLSNLPPPEVQLSGWPWADESPPLPQRMSNGEPWPRISIVTPSLNQGRFIEEAIRSVLLQGYPDLEYIVVDGGSTDDSVEVIRKYEPWLTYWTSEPDSGQADAINRGFEKSTGQIMGWLNSDDTYLPGALRVVAEGLTCEGDEAGAVVGAGLRVDVQGRTLGVRHMPEVNYQTILNWLRPNYFAQPSCFFTRRAWVQCGPLDTSLQYSFDLAFWLEIAREFDFKRTDAVLSASAVHFHAKTMAFPEQSSIETALVFARHGREDLARHHLARMAKRAAKYRRLQDRLRPFLLFARWVRGIAASLYQMVNGE